VSGAPGVAIVGCGLIGGKRAAALGPARLVACADLDRGRADALAARHRAIAGSVDDVLRRDDVEVVVVAATNDALAPLAIAALEAGKHVIVEKPAARSVAELDRIAAAATRVHRLVRVGFNHRYHPALQQARALVDAGQLGPLMFLRGRYGHGFAATYFWDMPVDDNAFLTLRTASGAGAFLHVSCTEWKNLFSLEIYGRTGKIAIDGLGGSYGVERLTFYKMLPEMGPPETTASEYPRGDQSWALEWAEFLDDIRLDRTPSAGLAEARAALDVVATIYRRSGYAT